MREIRATNQEERYLAGLNRKIDEARKDHDSRQAGHGRVRQRRQRHHTPKAWPPLSSWARSPSFRAHRLHAAVLFLLVITRVYAPFDSSLAHLIAEMFVSRA